MNLKGSRHLQGLKISIKFEKYSKWRRWLRNYVRKLKLIKPLFYRCSCRKLIDLGLLKQMVLL